MTLQSVLLRLSWESVAHFEGSAASTTETLRKLLTPLASGAVFHLLNLLFQVPYLLFQASQRSPLLLQNVDFRLVGCGRG
jgi:hypothetical protein